MKKLSLIKTSALMMMMAAPLSSAYAECKRIDSFYPYWTVNSSKPMNTIRWKQLTGIHVAFAIPNADGTLNTSNIDSYIGQLVTKAHLNDVEVSLSIGGAGNSQNFLSIVADAGRQTTFINAVKNYVAKHNLDLVDIDWEYWTKQDVNGTAGNDPVESQQLVDLMAALRKALPSKVKLSIDIFAGSWKGPQYKSDLAKHVDYINAMLYDFTGKWSGSAIAHHASLSDFNARVKELKAKFPEKKLVLGIPFYGKEFVNGSNTEVKHTAHSVVSNLIGNGDINAGQVGNVYYETPNNVRAKALVAAQGDFAGVMSWELSQDTTKSSHSLLNAITEVIPKSSDCNSGSDNQAPTARAGVDQTVKPSETVYLSGSQSSDPENTPLTYNWQQASGTSVTLTNANTTLPSFVAPGSASNLAFSLTVSDGKLSHTDLVTVTVAEQGDNCASQGVTPTNYNVYPNFPRLDWKGDPSHAKRGDRMRHNNVVWQANWWANSEPNVNANEWELVCRY